MIRRLNMEASTLFLPLIFFFTWYCCIYLLRSLSGSRKLPPGPRPLPVVGNMFHLGGVLHATLGKLSQTYGSLMSLKLGNRTVVVVSSPEIAKELLQKNELKCCGRTIPEATKGLDHHKLSVVWLPATETHWRNLRKLCKENMFSTERLNASQGLRQKLLRQMCDYVQECCITSQAVDIGEVAFTTSLNLISNTLFSVDFAGYDSNSSQECKELMWAVMKNSAAPNLADFFPILKALDPQGIRRQNKFYLEKLLDFIDRIMNERLQERGTLISYSRRDDFLEVLLDLAQGSEAEWTYNDIRHLFVDLLVGGTETTSSTVEWAMTELIRNPTKMSKARAEIEEVVAKNELVQESNFSRLLYLQALVKETYRLHPAGTLLLREASADIEINQYLVPKDAQLFVNLWSIGRDQSIWSNPDLYVPERFLDSEIDVKGQHFELLTFGTGRKICLGLPLAQRMVHLMVASLIQKFDWKLEEGLRPEDMDMTEKFGLSVQKAIPLKAIPVAVTI